MLAALCSSGSPSFNCAAGSGSGLCALAETCIQTNSVIPVAVVDVCKFTEAGSYFHRMSHAEMQPVCYLNGHWTADSACADAAHRECKGFKNMVPDSLG